MTVHFVGAGPGSADLLTFRGATLLGLADVVLYAGTYIDNEILAHCRPDSSLIDTQHLNLDEITEHLVTASRQGFEVTRLCSGDPSLYSALTEQTRRLDIAGISWDVTPGVPAYAAAAARLGIELTVPELAQTVVLTRTRVQSTLMPQTESLTAVARIGASLVLHLSITRIRALAAELTDEYGSDCPAAVVAFASRPAEVTLRGTLADIADQVEATGLKHTAVILVGRALGASSRPNVACSHLYDPSRIREV